MKKNVNESASSGATSSGAIASTPNGMHFSLLKRMPPTNIFGGYSPVPENKQKKKKKNNGK